MLTHRNPPSPSSCQSVSLPASERRPVSSPTVPPAGEGEQEEEKEEEEWREEPVNGSLQAFLLRGLKAGPSYRVRLVARGADGHQPAHLSEELVVTVPGEGEVAAVCVGRSGRPQP